MKKNQTSHIYGINLLRILCMLWVLLFHARIHCNFSVGIENIDRLIAIGAVGCQGFFMTSGFTLRNKYKGTEWTKGSIKTYLSGRLIGVYPVYAAFTVLAIVCKYRLPDDLPALLDVLPMQLSLLQVWFFPGSYSVMYNDNFWFLSVLFTLYLLFPLLNWITTMLSIRAKRILCIILPVVSFYCYYTSISLGLAFQSYYMSPLFRIFEFCLGIVLVDLAADSSIKIEWYTVCGVTVLCVILLLSAFPCFGTRYNLYNIILLPYFALLLFSASKSTKRGVGASRPVQYLSECGLCIYSCQSITIMLKPQFICYPGISYIIVTMIAAVLMHEIVEKPCKRMLPRFLGGSTGNLSQF